MTSARRPSSARAWGHEPAISSPSFGPCQVNVPSLSCRYIWNASAICLQLERQAACRAFSRAWAKTGNRIAARMAMMAMTTRSSISVNPRRRGPELR